MWENLSKEEKKKYKKYCDNKYGPTICFCETGEPIYFDENFNKIDTRMIIELLFNIQKN